VESPFSPSPAFSRIQFGAELPIFTATTALNSVRGHVRKLVESPFSPSPAFSRIQFGAELRILEPFPLWELKP
jgi:hypothetical protein